MKNISTEGEGLFLLKKRKYLVIDSLYLESIKDWYNKKNISLEKLLLDKRNIFPYSDDDVFCIYTSKDSDLESYETIEFSVERIKDYQPNSIISSELLIASDSGLLVLVEESIVESFINACDSDEIIDYITNGEIMKEQEKFNSWLNDSLLGIILAPDVNSGFEFVGSGRYIISG